MALILTVLEIVAPVFLLATVGFTWVKLGFEYRIQFVTQLAMTLSVPCLIFVSLMQAEMDPSALTALTLASFAAYLGVTLVVWLCCKIGRLNTRTYMAPLIFGNTGNLGLPLALFAFGEAGLSNAIVVFAVMAILSFTFGIWLVSGEGALGKVVREPLVGATLLGALFLVAGLGNTPVPDQHTVLDRPNCHTNHVDHIGRCRCAPQPARSGQSGVSVADQADYLHRRCLDCCRLLRAGPHRLWCVGHSNRNTRRSNLIFAS